MAKNPFQSRDRQHFPAYSPSMFKPPNTPSSTEKNGSFRWSIDHLAVLHPADINAMQEDISPSSNDVGPDAQRSVERFFSQRMIVPSPWTQDKASTKHVTFSPHPPDTAYFREESFNESCNGKMVDACCQTSVTIPVNCDLEALLGPDFVYHDNDERRIKDCGNTSLRRKLFGQPSRLSPNENEAAAGRPCQSTPPISTITSPVTTLTTGPLLSNNMAATPNIILTTSPSPSSSHHRSSFPVDSSPYHCMSPIPTVATPADSPYPSSLNSKSIVSPKLSPIKAKSFVTPDGMTTPNVHPSSGKSTSTPVLKRVQPTGAVEDNADDHRSNSSQSDSCSCDHTPELLSLEDLCTNTYELTSVDMAMPSSSISDHGNPTVTMETTKEKVITTKPNASNSTTTSNTVVTNTATTSTISHGGGAKSASDSGIAGSSVEMSTQLRDDFTNHLQASCSASEQLNVKKSLSIPPSHSNKFTIFHGEHHKEVHHHPSAVDSGLGYNLRATSHAHNADESIVTLHGDLPAVSESSSATDSNGTASSLRTEFSGILLPMKYRPPVEESTPKSRYGMPPHSDKNKWAWLPRHTSTSGESFSSFAEGVLLRKEILKSELQFGPVSSLCEYSNITPTTTVQHSFSRYHSPDYNCGYPTTPLSSRTTGTTTTAAVRYRSPLSDKVLNKNHSKLNRLHLGSFRSRFNRFTLDTSITTPVSVTDRLSPAHHLTAGSHTHSVRMWPSSRERYDDWKRSMERWESAIRTQYYATVDS